MLTRKMIVAMFVAVWISVNLGWAESYTYVLTVGMDANDPNYDPNSNYDTINEAIVAMNAKSPPLDELTLGCIQVYPEPNGAPKVYFEQLNDYYEDCNNLPAHCDLIGMGQEIDDVVIQHRSNYDWDGPPYGIIEAGVNCEGNNILSHLKILNQRPEGEPNGWVQNGVRFNGDGQLLECIVDSKHLAVRGGCALTVDNCTIKSVFGSCVYAEGYFTISDSNLEPRSFSPNLETPKGIEAKSSGVIEKVNIDANCTYNGSIYDPAGVQGISLYLEDDEYVRISNTNIKLQLISKYHTGEPCQLEVWGVTSEISGKAIIQDCSIQVTGIEDAGDPNDPNDDGAGIKVNGIGATGTANVELWGYTDVTTSRTTAGHAADGYEYSLNNDANSTLAVDVDPNLVSYDPNKTNGTISDLIRASNITQVADYNCIQDAIDDANSGDIIEVREGVHYETVDFVGKAITLKNSYPENFLRTGILGGSIIDANSANEAVLFESGEDSNSVLTGLTLRNAVYSIRCKSSSSPTIKNNWVYGSNYGIYLDDANCSAEIRNNTIVDNAISGVYVASNASPDIINCIIWDCNDDLYDCNATYSCIEDGDSGPGNISDNPQFLDSSNRDYHIGLSSPCVDAGDPNGSFSETDIDHDNRVVDGNNDGNSVVDMGADEMLPRAHNITQDKIYISIQDSIDDANDGDTIEVLEVIHYEEIDFKGRGITLQSADPGDWDVVSGTIIHSRSRYKAVEFSSGEDTNSVLKGVTVKKGKYGIWCSSSSLCISNCIIEENKLGVYSAGGSATIKNNKIRRNSGEGICCASGVADIENNWIYRNKYGIVLAASNANIGNNTIVYNTYQGIMKFSSCVPTISNCIIWGNGDDLHESFSATYSCISDCNDVGDPNTTHNICDNPLFVDANSDDYHLDTNSPCIDAGDPNGDYDGEKDIDGQPRVMVTEVDMGADEAAYMPTCHPDYNEWVAVGKPACWCYQRQCHGDADGLKYSDPNGWFYVGQPDLDLLNKAWKVKEPPHGPGIGSVENGICADFGHDLEGSPFTGYYRVGTSDLNILVEYWKILEPPDGNGVDPNCLECE